MGREVDFAQHLVDVADAITMARFRAHDLQVSTKPDNTPVTEADQEVERTLRKLIREEFPDDGIIGEEEYDIPSHTGRSWVLDPIDGTKNYLRGVPVWATLIGLLEGQQAVMGMMSAPAMGRRWWAQHNEGAFTQDVGGQVRQIHVSAVSDLADASLSYSDVQGWERYPDALRQLQSNTWRSRAYGDFWSHALVAEGAIDIAIEPELGIWDMVAFAAIVAEAGGIVTALDGGTFIEGGNALSTNGFLHYAGLSLIRPQA